MVFYLRDHSRTDGELGLGLHPLLACLRRFHFGIAELVRKETARFLIGRTAARAEAAIFPEQ
jgi:hypothetical protein